MSEARNSVQVMLACVDELLAADHGAVDGPELLDLVREVETLGRRLAAVDHVLIAQMESRRLAGDYARCSTAELLVSELRVAPGEAKARVAAAQDLGPRHSFTGEPLPALMPALAAAVIDGEISSGHVAVIRGCLDAVPTTLDAAAVSVVEQTLVQAARHQHPGALRTTARHLLARLDPDGEEPRERELHRRRALTLAGQLDGAARLSGRLTPECAAVWATILDALSAPHPAGDGTHDVRTGTQRRHDALLEAGHRLLRSGSLPPAGGVPVTILAITTATELQAGHGSALTSHGQTLSLHDLLTGPGSDAEILPITLGEHGELLNLGRRVRLATCPQRLALVARDRGCCFPGCGWSASPILHSCQASQHQLTAVRFSSDPALHSPCRYHHREFERQGWRVIMTDGIPHWIPPHFIDRERRPRRNHTHHLHDHGIFRTTGPPALADTG